VTLRRFGVLAIATSLVAVVGYWTTNNEGPIARAFYDTPRDSFGSDTSQTILKVLPAGMHHPDIERTFASDGFDCHRSQLLTGRQLWTCQRRAVRLNGLPNNERWVVEFECKAGLAPCTIEKLHAEVRV
jgi:hypothetical protein